MSRCYVAHVTTTKAGAERAGHAERASRANSPRAQTGGGPARGAEPTDRRVRRSRRELHRALVELSIEKGYDAVTVDDLAGRADIARRTFYAHYVDKDDLLRAIVDELLADLLKDIGAVQPPDMRSVRGTVVKQMFTHGQDHRDVYRVILAGAGGGLGLRLLANTLSDYATDVFNAQCQKLGLTPRLPIDFVARSFVGQHLTLLRWWLDGQTDYTLDAMTDMRVETMIHGEAWALGFDPDDITFDRSELAERSQVRPEVRRGSR
jgi:AcrR family transcriptional regulator